MPVKSIPPPPMRSTHHQTEAGEHPRPRAKGWWPSSKATLSPPGPRPNVSGPSEGDHPVCGLRASASYFSRNEKMKRASHSHE